MPGKKPVGAKSSGTKPAVESAADPKTALDRQIQEKLRELSDKRGFPVYPLLTSSTHITSSPVDDVFDDLRAKFPSGNERMEVLVHSSGGDIHAAYNLGLLIRRYAPKELNFTIPRWAKSAATLLACSGNKVYMTPVAEMGPIDPQITQMNPLESRLEEFSPLHIEATLELIRGEFKNGEKELATGLLERLQFPLTLGGFKKSLSIGREYLRRLLTTRMFDGQDKAELVKSIGSALVEGYSDHGFCIDVNEARQIGLVVDELQGDVLALVWDIFKLGKERERLEQDEKEREMQEMLKRLGPDVLKLVPNSPPQEDGRLNCARGGRFMQGGSMRSDEGFPGIEAADKIGVAARIAKEAIKQRGEITVDHVKAIPFLTAQEVDLVVDYLVRYCKAEIVQRKVGSEPVLRWQRFIILKKV
jgi:hypothetical protein